MLHIFKDLCCNLPHKASRTRIPRSAPPHPKLLPPLRSLCFTHVSYFLEDVWFPTWKNQPVCSGMPRICETCTNKGGLRTQWLAGRFTCSKELPNSDRNGCSKWLKCIMGKTWENSSNKPLSFQTSPSYHWHHPMSLPSPRFPLMAWNIGRSQRICSKILGFQLSQHDLNLNRSTKHRVFFSN